MQTRLFQILFFLTIVGTGQSQPGFLRVVREVGLQDGLSDQRVKYIFQDRDGLIWLNTANGFQRFDGKRFLTINFQPGQDPVWLPSGIMNYGIDQDSAGLIWSVTEHEGPVCFDPETQTLRKVESDSLSHLFLRAHDIVSVDKKTVFATSVGGLIRITNGRALPVAMSKTVAGNSELRNQRGIASDKEGNLWIASSGGFLQYNIHTGSWYHPGNNPHQLPILHSPLSIAAMTLDEKNQIWYSTWDHVGKPGTRYLYRYHLQKQVLDSVRLPEAPVNGNDFYNISEAIISDRQGHVLVASLGARLFLYNQQMELENSYKGVAAGDNTIEFESITSLFCDRDGSIWIACQDGLFLSPPLSAGTTKSEKIPAAEFSWQHHQSRLRTGIAGTVMISTLGAPPRYWNTAAAGPKAFPQNLVPGKWQHYLTWVAHRGNDHFWVPWFSDEVIRWNAATGKYYPFIPPKKLGHLSVKAVALDSSILFSGKDWIYRTDLSGRITDSIRISDSSLFISDWKADNAGNVWIVNVNSAIYRLRVNGRMEAVPIPAPVLRGEIFTLAVFDQHLVIGTHYQGLFVLDHTGQVVRTLTTREGLLSNTINRLTTDPHGILWIETPVGFNYLYSSSDAEVMSSWELDKRYRQYIAACHDGRKGFFLLYRDRIDHLPALQLQPPGAVPFLFTSIRSGHNRTLVSPEKAPELKWNNNQLEFEFAALDYLHAPMLQYRYSLGREWIPLGDEGKILLPSLEPGKYNLEIEYRQPNGQWSAVALAYHFSIHGPFWERAWFIILATLLAISPFAIYWWRKSREQKQIARIRWQLSRDLHDDVGSTLSSIGIYSTVLTNRLKDEKEIIILNEIREKAQATIQEMADIVWAIQPENDKLTSFIQRFRSFAVPLLESRLIHIRWQDQVARQDLSLSTLQRRNLYLVCKEALNNMLKYAHATEFSFSCRQENNRVHIRLEENGTGFDETSLTRKNGLLNMRQRIEEIGGKIEIKSRKGNGTVIEITLVT